MQTAETRIFCIDTAKTVGMFLVFYGHFVQRMYNLGSTAAFMQFKFIYAFHMPLFFVLSGCVYKPDPLPIKDFLKKKFYTRIVPILFFNAVSFILIVAKDLLRDSVDVDMYQEGFVHLLQGTPTFNGVTWFLFCLSAVELFGYMLNPRTRSNMSLAISGGASLAVGFFITWKIDFFTVPPVLIKNFWYVHEAFIAFGFYQFGLLLRRSGVLDRTKKLLPNLLLAGLLLCGVCYSFNLNQGLFIHNIPVVLMVYSSHGNPLLFLFTALAASCCVILLVRAAPRNRLVVRTAPNMLILLGMSGFFHRFFNAKIASLWYPPVSESHVVMFLICAAVTLASLGACVPCIVILNRFFPYLVGKRPAAPRPAGK